MYGADRVQGVAPLVDITKSDHLYHQYEYAKIRLRPNLLNEFIEPAVHCIWFSISLEHDSDQTPGRLWFSTYIF